MRMVKPKGRHKSQTGPKISVTPERRAEVKRLREALGWQQKDLAHRIGVNPATISNLETGRHPQIYQTVWFEVVRVLKISDTGEAGDRFNRTIEKLAKLDERGQITVEALIDSLLGTRSP